MSFKKKVSALFVALFTAGPFAQSMVVDMDTASGIQAAFSSKSTGQLLAIQIRITGAVSLFSYQCKVAFDTSRLAFADAQLDGGFQGEKNILSRNGSGAPIGVRQLQQNPPAADTVEISGSITGTDPTKSVSGDGLIGVLYFTSKTAVGDSCAITVGSGFTAPFGGDLAAITNYTGGKYRVVAPVSTVPHHGFAPGRADTQGRQTIIVTIGTSETAFEIPPDAAARATSPTFRLFTGGGRLIATRSVQLTRTNVCPAISVLSPGAMLAGGAYIGSFDFNGSIVSKTIRHK